ncbi:MAG TPA: capsule assembly Wzi family protein, partial [Gemmatirosa sp.]
PQFIDNPQRFGARPYARFDLGQSTVRADVLGLTAGLTTANEWIGPTLQDPLIMGDNAAGMPRMFAGTSKPLNVGIGTLHARLEAGRLSQSAYSPMPADSAYRLGMMFTAVGTIRGVPGLELGVTRFVHEFWPGLDNVAARLGAPFGKVYAPTTADQGAIQENELASVFARWVLTPARVEVWGEYMRNDFAANARDLLVEPDHDAGWVLGARRVWIRRDGGLTAVRIETLNTRVTHLERVRLQARPYEHTPIRQGHTELGEVLGSFSGEGGLATTVGLDRYRADGRWTFEYDYRVRQTSLGEAAPSNQWDVYHVLRAERLRFGRARDLFTGAAVIADLNRNFVRDAYGLRLDAGWRFGSRSRNP